MCAYLKNQVFLLSLKTKFLKEKAKEKSLVAVKPSFAALLVSLKRGSGLITKLLA